MEIPWRTSRRVRRPTRVRLTPTGAPSPEFAPPHEFAPAPTRSPHVGGSAPSAAGADPPTWGELASPAPGSAEPYVARSRAAPQSVVSPAARPPLSSRPAEVGVSPATRPPAVEPPRGSRRSDPAAARRSSHAASRGDRHAQPSPPPCAEASCGPGRRHVDGQRTISPSPRRAASAVPSGVRPVASTIVRRSSSRSAPRRAVPPPSHRVGSPATSRVGNRAVPAPDSGSPAAAPMTRRILDPIAASVPGANGDLVAVASPRIGWYPRVFGAGAASQVLAHHLGRRRVGVAEPVTPR